MPTRKPARVLPEPVGAAMSVSRPAAMWAQPSSWAGVGPSGNRRANQVATAGWKPSAGSPTTLGSAWNRVGLLSTAILRRLTSQCDSYARVSGPLEVVVLLPALGGQGETALTSRR